MKMLRYMVICVVFGVVLINACKKEDTYTKNKANVPMNHNPYDTLTFNQDTASNISVDPNSIVGLHQNIFSTKCNVPGCHDGNFEPDFRTILSTYNTLVYHPIEKNNSDSAFTYRVIPKDTARSVLHERLTNCCFVNFNDRMPQSFIGQALPDEDIAAITTWIMNGAKDMFGGDPSLANNEPRIAGIVAYLNDTTGKRVDTTRSNPFMAFVVPQDTLVDIWFGVYDEDYADSINWLEDLGASFTYNKIKYTTDPYGFDTAQYRDLEHISNILNAHYAPSLFSSSNDFPYFHHYKLNTTGYNIGDIVYLRIYVNDNEHSSPTEIPDDGAQSYLKAFMSLKIEN